MGPATERPFGRGPAISPFTLGTMRALGSPAQMEAVLRAALAAGINHLETAPAYGPAESFLGQALNALAAEGLAPEGGWRITSKLLPGSDLATAQQQLRAILARLGVAQLTTLAVHGLNRPEHLDWATGGPGAELLTWASGEGLVGQVAFSSHGSPELIEAALATGRFTACSLHLHLFDQTRLPLARAALAAGIGVLAISPADKGGRLYDPPPELLADCAPFHPLELAYRFLLDQGISTLSLGAEQPGRSGLGRRHQRALALAECRATLSPAAPGCSRPRTAGGRALRPVPRMPALPQRRADPRAAAPAQPGRGPRHGGLCRRALQPDRPRRPLVGGAQRSRLRGLRRLPAPLPAAAAHPRSAGRHPPPPGRGAAAAPLGLVRAGRWHPTPSAAPAARRR